MPWCRSVLKRKQNNLASALERSGRRCRKNPSIYREDAAGVRVHVERTKAPVRLSALFDDPCHGLAVMSRNLPLSVGIRPTTRPQASRVVPNLQYHAGATEVLCLTSFYIGCIEI